MNSTQINNFVENNKSYMFLLLAGVFINLVFSIANSVNIPIISYLGALSLLLISSLLKVRYNVLLLVFLFPNQRDIVLLGSDATLLNLIIIIVFLRLLWVNAKLPIKLSMISLLLIIYALNAVVRLESFFAVSSIAKACILIVALSMFAQKIKIDKEMYYNLVKFLVFGCLSSGFIGLFLNYNFIGDSTIRFTAGVNNDPNIYASILAFSIANLLVLFLYNMRKGKWYTTSLLSLLFMGLLTQSRSFILTTLISVVVVLIFQKSIRKRFKFAIIVSSIALFSYLILNLFSDSYIGNVYMTFSDRIFNPRNGDISGGRLELWSDYGYLLLNNKEVFLFGIGDSFREMGFLNVAHNMIIDSIVSYGIIGLGFIIWIYASFLKYISTKSNKRKKGKTIMIAYIPLISMLIANSTLYSFISISMILQFFISFICISVCIEDT